MRLRAMAKINLGLDVVRRRPDGYHEVRMIMQTIHLYDVIELQQREETGIRVETNLPFLPTDKNNLVYRAASLLMEEFKLSQGLTIRLEKHIPVAAGLAGGSADAAAVLVGVNKLFKLGLTMQELMERGVKIGADVPYCVMRGTVLAEGIGEKLTVLPKAPDCYVLIAKPPVSVSTKFVYENLHLDTLKEHPDIDGMIESIRAGCLKGVAEKLGNVLETVTIPAYPVIDEIKKQMLQNGALNAMMSGSGPTVFGLFESRETAQRAQEAIRSANLAKSVYVTELFHNQQ